jgi:large subunit ribosomal protein L22
MDVAARARFVRLSPFKARDLARRVQGLPVAEALKITEFSSRKAAALIGKTIKSAIANAEKNAKLNVDDLRVKMAVVDEGPRLKRYWPRARGSVRPIQRRTSHIRIVLTDGEVAVAAQAEAS